MPVQHRRVKLVRWWLFSVLVGLVPLITSYLALQLDPQPPPLYTLTARGELLLISVAIAAAAVGELLPGDHGKAVQKLLAGGGCVLLILASSLIFSTIQAGQHPNAVRIFATSIWLFCGTLLASFSAVYLAWGGGEP